MRQATIQDVRRRAGYRCEYCHLPEDYGDFRHEIDHIVPKKHHGLTVRSNLALCCGRCNLHKGTDLTGIDPDTTKVKRLFHPRRDRWQDHFRWSGLILSGLTPVGRTTIEVLRINDPDRIATRRQILQERGPARDI